VPSQGPYSPASIVNNNTGGLTNCPWVNPSNAGASDNAYAESGVLPGGGTFSNLSDFLVATDFGFTIPTNATIDGILVEAEVSTDTTGDVVRFRANLKNVGGGNRDKNPYTVPGSDTYESFGGAADLWSSSAIYSGVNSSTFGVQFQLASIAAGGDALNFPVKCDHIRITVYYTEATITNKNAADSLDVQFSSEAGSPRFIDADADTLASAISEAEVATVKPSSTDSLAVAITDAGAFIAKPVSTDTLSVALSETEDVTVGPLDTDTLNVAISDDQVVGIDGLFTSTDALAISLNEVEFAGSFTPDSDSIAVAFSDEDTDLLITTHKSANDTVLSEISDEFGHDFGRVETDTLSVAITESQLATGIFAEADTLASSMAETMLAIERHPDTESLAVAIADAPLTGITVHNDDALGVRIGDAAVYGVIIFEDDADIDVAITETLTYERAWIVFDAIDVTVTETHTTSVDAFGGDFVNVRLADMPLATRALGDADALAVVIVDVGTAVGTTHGTDALAVAIADVATDEEIPFVKTQGDALSVTLPEATAIARETAATDAMAVAIGEVWSTQYVALAGADTLAVALSELAAVSREVTTADVLALSLAEATTPLTLRLVGIDALGIAFQYETPIIFTAGPVVDSFIFEFVAPVVEADLELAQLFNADVILQGPRKRL